MDEHLLELLHGIPIFDGVSQQAFEHIFQNCSFVKRLRGEFFFHQDEHAESFFVLDAGTVAVFRDWHGENYVLRQLNAGDCFGEMALMHVNIRSASVQALETSTALEINIDQFNDLGQVYPDQFTLIMMNMGREVCKRLLYTEDELFSAWLENKDQKPDLMGTIT